MDALLQYDPVLLALAAGLFTWVMTTLGAGTVFLSKSVNIKLHDVMLAFAAGVMTAASYWSLLAPAIEMAEELPVPSWLPAVSGFLAGVFFLWGLDRLLPHLHPGLDMKKAEGLHTGLKKSILLVMAVTLHNIPEGLAVGNVKSILLVMAVTLHNIPEGLAVGVAFGALSQNLPGAVPAGAVALALGIGIQNFPEGAAVSFPLRQAGVSRRKSFFYGQLSGLVEPLSAVLGALAVVAVKPLLPFALAFAAGAMIFVVIEDAVPDSQQHGNVDLATMGFTLGFTVMMLLDVALG